MEYLRYGGSLGGSAELEAARRVLSSTDWASGTETARFEQHASRVQGRAHSLFVNSGSSGLLLAAATITTRPARVAIPALCFPTALSALHWCGHQPVLVDVDETFNLDPEALRAVASSLDGVMFVHVAGNPTNIEAVASICSQHDLFLIEDICEAFGAVAESGRRAGNFGHVAVTSTHGAHQISTGEGGILFTDDPALALRARQLRDWGRAYGEVAIDSYPSAFTYARLGLNLRASDIQAAIGSVQLSRLDDFVQSRARNYDWLKTELQEMPLRLPRVGALAAPSWYSFPFALREPVRRAALTRHLEADRIETRPLLVGNIARQPLAGFDSGGSPNRWPNADVLFDAGVWVSVHPSLGTEGLSRIVDSLRGFFG